MELKFGEEQMRAIVTKALVEGVGEEQRTLILTQAVEYLLGVPEERSGYSYNTDKRNRLQRSFDAAAERAMDQVAREEVTKPENLERIRALLGPIVEQALTNAPGYAKIRQAIAEAIASAFEKS